MEWERGGREGEERERVGREGEEREGEGNLLLIQASLVLLLREKRHY